MYDTDLTEMDEASAIRFLGKVEPSKALQAGILSPMAGTKKVRLFSIRDVERFLVSPSAGRVLAGGPMGTVNYVDPAGMADWVEDVLGDADLAQALREVIDSGRAYGFIVPELKELIAHRIGQSEAASIAKSA